MCIRDRVYTAYMRGDRKMRYFEADLKSERPVYGSNGEIKQVLPSREDSLDRLMEEKMCIRDRALAVRRYSRPTAEQIELVREELGLDKPILQQYGSWLWNALHGDCLLYTSIDGVS